MNDPLELTQWAAPRVGELGRGDYKEEKHLLHQLLKICCAEGADLFCGITKGSALASDEVFREANFGFDSRKNLLSKLSQDSIGCLRKGAQMRDWS